MGTMEIARSDRDIKTNALSTIARNTSCNQGWLRMVIQTTFAVIIVSSFILILIMAIQTSPSVFPPPPISRCHINICRVMCNRAPYFGDYEEDIINMIVNAKEKCSRISLGLNNPTFINSTLPPKWLSSLRVSIHELSIHRGNLMHISPYAFMSHSIGGIRRIQFIGITVRRWAEESFLGLSNLEEFSIEKSNIVIFEANALRALDDTLQTLSIIKSNFWDPINVTGTVDFTKLTVVDLSFNNFNNILDHDSFTGLTECKILNLNSSRITAIGAGSFDYLYNIEVIYLNNNLLTTIPSGLFDNIMLSNREMRLNLQDNLWLCDCSSKELRNLATSDVLLSDPVCHYPEDIQGITFSKFEHYCNNKTEVSNVTNQGNYIVRSEDEYIYINGTCCDNNIYSNNVSYRLHSPILQYQCVWNEMIHFNILTFPGQINDRVIRTSSKCLKLNFFLETETYSVVQIDSSRISGYGLLWYHSKCPYEIYCIKILPNFLRVYNVEVSSRYTFCPFEIKTGLVDVENCIGYDKSSIEIVNTQTYFGFQILLYIFTGLICLTFGALCVYGMVRRNPWLLKGSKRIVFVKHKTVDALVLPPKMPLRNELVNEITPHVESKSIYVVSGNHVKCNNLSPSKYNTQKSVRSITSGTPSYVSALQPTDDQLAEWRINNHFNNDLTVTSASNLSVVSWICSGDSLYSTGELEKNRIYESL